MPNVPILMPFSLADTPKPEAVTHGRNTPSTTSDAPGEDAPPACARADAAGRSAPRNRAGPGHAPA